MSIGYTVKHFWISMIAGNTYIPLSVNMDTLWASVFNKSIRFFEKRRD